MSASSWLGLALCDGIVAVLEDPAISRWGLADIEPAEDVDARPLFTAESAGKALSYYVVGWKQTLYSVGTPFMDMDSAAVDNVRVLLPGDPSWVPPSPPGVGGPL
jgi:hypothetical protein